jgi:hypothetical protein
VAGTRPKSSNRIRTARLVIATCLCLASAGLFAQATGTTTGDLRGRVTDESGAVLPGVLVSATSRETALTRSDTTRSDGKFAIRLLPLAPYRVSAALDGFETLEVESVRVALGSSANLDLRLKIATVTEAVTVGARVALIDPTSTDVSQTIDETMIRNLPINQRDFLDFALTAPGVEADRGPQTGAASTSGLSINGQSPRQNNVLVDGLDNNDQAVGSVRSTFSQDAVEEYQVIQSSFAAEHGRATGGIVNIVTRSGSNDLHGSAFYFFRDDSLAADNALAGAKTPFEQHQFGATVGGPLLRERLFAFGAVERLSVSDANVVTISDDAAFDAISAIRAAGFDVETGVVPFDRDRTAAIVKLDWAPRPAHRLSLRGTYAEERDENQQAWGGLVARSAGGVRRIEDTAVAAAGISVISESLSNEARVLYAGRRHRLESLDPTGGVSVSILGVASFGADPTLPQPRDTRIFQAFDAVSFFRGNASYKVGVDYLRTEIEGRLPLYFGGRYLFSGDLGPSSFDAFRLGRPLVFLQGFGDPRLEDSTTEVAAFAQGEWGVGERVLLRAGLRYDYEDPIAPFPKDSNNWSPRLSISWTGGTTWRIHGGVGRFYGVVPIAPASLIAIENGVRARIIARSIVDDPSSEELWASPGRRFAGEPGGEPVTIYRLGGFESAYSDQATVGFEKALARTLLFHLDYLHARGRKVLIEHNVNPVDPVHGRPDAGHGDVFAYDSVGNTWYDALTAGLRTGPGRLLELAAHYTYADAEDDHIDWSKNQPQDPRDIDAERGPTVHVPRHHAVLSAIWTAAGRTKAWWRRDWTAAVIADYASGFPYNELAGFDRNGNMDAFSDRPEGVRRNSRTLPDFFNVDLRVARRFLVGRAALEAIIEVFNLFDRENVLEVNNVRYRNAGLEPNPFFGQPTRVADPRRVQVGARLTF